MMEFSRPRSFWCFCCLVFQISYVQPEMLSNFQKIPLPLFVELENNFMKAVWTDNLKQCAIECNTHPGCKSFLYSNKACYEETSHRLYRGVHSTTFSGKTCQTWSSTSTHHNYSDADFPDVSVAVARNFCRDPGNKGFLWCFTTDPAQEWEPCDIPQCGQHFSDGLCQETFTSTSYNGGISVTNNGRVCQRWDRQYPHSHDYGANNLYIDGSTSAAGNKCRDQIGQKFNALWCYTTNPSIRWESCDVPHCSNVIPLERCYKTSDHYDYPGSWSLTITGIKCQRWDTQTPHSHTDTDDQNFPDSTLADAANYCRDPDGSGFLWCYTTDPTIRRQPCGIAKCTNESPCRTFASTTYYSGSWSTTYTGKTCQRWDSQSPHSHPFTSAESFHSENVIGSTKNFCRDPNGSGRLWCYTTDPDTVSEPCDIPTCHPDEGNCRMFSIAANPAPLPVIKTGYVYHRKVAPP